MKFASEKMIDLYRCAFALAFAFTISARPQLVGPPQAIIPKAQPTIGEICNHDVEVYASWSHPEYCWNAIILPWNKDACMNIFSYRYPSTDVTNKLTFSVKSTTSRI